MLRQPAHLIEGRDICNIRQLATTELIHIDQSGRLFFASQLSAFKRQHEFFGSLYHLNAEDEPEHPDYFKDPEMRIKYGTRGVIRSWANPDGTQKIESTGPLNKKRMEMIDEEVTVAAKDFLKRAKEANKPFFMWWNSTRMHIWTRLKKESEGKTGLGIYPDGMVEHDTSVVRPVCLASGCANRAPRAGPEPPMPPLKGACRRCSGATSHYRPRWNASSDGHPAWELSRVIWKNT